MNTSDMHIKRVWEQPNLLRYEIILYLLRENPSGLTKHGIIKKITGYSSDSPCLRHYLKDLEDDG